MQSLLWKLARKYILATVVDGNVEDYPRWDHVEYVTYKVLKWIKYLVFCVKLSICNFYRSLTTTATSTQIELD